jgi:hypothetical protein
MKLFYSILMAVFMIFNFAVLVEKSFAFSEVSKVVAMKEEDEGSDQGSQTEDTKDEGKEEGSEEGSQQGNE